MPSFIVSNETHKRLEAFKPLLEYVTDESITIETCLDVVVNQGLNAMLGDLIGSLDHSILLKSMQQLASKYPTKIYEYIIEMMKIGEMENEKEKLKHKIGF